MYEMNSSSPLIQLSSETRHRKTIVLPINKSKRRRLAKHILPPEIYTNFVNRTSHIDIFSTEVIYRKGVKHHGQESLYESIAFYIFNDSCPDYVSALRKHTKQQNTCIYDEFDPIIGIACQLDVNIFVFTDRSYPPTQISPKILNETTESENDGSIFLNFDSRKNVYFPVTGYDADAIVLNRGHMSLTLYDCEGNTMSMESSLLCEISKTFAFWHRQEIDTELSQSSFKKFRQYVSDPWSLNICLMTDSDLYNFSRKFQIKRLTELIESKMFFETNPEYLLKYLSNIKHVKNNFVEHVIRVIQKCDISTLERLASNNNICSIRRRLEMLYNFRHAIRSTRFTCPFAVIRMTENYSEVFADAWIHIPLNFRLYGLNKRLWFHRLHKCHLVKDETLLFVTDDKLGCVNLLSPYQPPRYYDIPTGVLDMESVQLCMSNCNNLYLFDFESFQYAPINGTFQVGNWMKLQEKDYIKSQLHGTKFQIINVNGEIIYCQTELSKQLIIEKNKTLYIFDVDKSCNAFDCYSASQADVSLNYFKIPYDDNNNSDDIQMGYCESDFYCWEEDSDEYIYFLVSTNVLESFATTLLRNSF